VAENVEEPLVASSESLHEFHCHSRTGALVDPDSGNHHAKDCVPEGEEVMVLVGEGQLVDGLVLFEEDLERAAGVDAVVRPQLLFGNSSVPEFAVVFPVKVMAAVHGGEEV
jgi:hypothetical protein